MATLEEAVRPEELDPEFLRLGNDELQARTRLLDNEIKQMRNELQRLMHEQQSMRERIKDNQDKIKVNRQLPYLVGNVVEVRRNGRWCWPPGTASLLEPRSSKTPRRAAARSWTSIRTRSLKRTAATSTWTRSGKERVRSSRHPHARFAALPALHAK